MAGVPQRSKEGSQVVHLGRGAGSCKAQYNLGWMYSKGVGVDKTTQKQMESQPTREFLAQNRLGIMYENGQGFLRRSQGGSQVVLQGH